jgi:hypothetical protein
MTRRTLFGIAAIVLGTFTPCRAALIVYDGFNYSPVGAPILGESGGGDFGWSGPWTGTLTAGYFVGGGSLTSPFPGEPSSGNMLSTGVSGGNKGTFRNLATSLGAPGTTDFFSFLMQPTGTVGSGFDDGHMGFQLLGTVNSLYAGKPGIGAANPNLYDIESVGGITRAPTTVAAVSGQTVLMVVRADFTAGNDTFKLYINPPSTTEPATPDAMLNSFTIGSVTALQVSGPGAFNFDELRVGTTFASVVPEPASIAMLVIGMLGLLVTGAARRRLSHGSRGRLAWAADCKR